MTLYFLWLKTSEAGCDYSIGCGERVIPLKTLQAAEVAAEVEKILEYHGLPNEDYPLVVAEVLAPTMNVISIVEARKAEKAGQKKIDEMDKKRAQLEALKKELGVK